MAKTFTAPYAQTPQRGTASTTAAHTTLNDISDDCALLATAGADGAVVTRLAASPLETVTTGVCYLYSSTDSGVSGKLLRAKAMAADTVSTTDAPAEIDFGYTESAPLRLKAAERLYVGFSLAKIIAWSCDQMDF